MHQLSLFGIAAEVKTPETKHNSVIEAAIREQQNGETAEENGPTNEALQNDEIAVEPTFNEEYIRDSIDEEITEIIITEDAITNAAVEEETAFFHESVADDNDVVETAANQTNVEEIVVAIDEATAEQTAPEEVVEFSLVPQNLVASVTKPVVKKPGKRGRKSFKEIDAEVDLIEVPEDEELFKKQYYSITIVAKWFRVNNSLLRYWENEFDILQPRKTRKGDRLFRPEDVKNLQVIYYLLRQRKFSIEGAKKYLKSNRKGVDTNLQIIQALTKFRGFLLEMKANLGL